MSEVKRATRVGERLREELANVVRTLEDPRIVGVMISRVELNDDLQSARVYVRHATSSGAAHIKALLRGLEAASGKLRKETAHAMKLRYAPALRFYYDEAPDKMNRIEELLREVKETKPSE
jgi:ribosome-binding factor A